MKWLITKKFAVTISSEGVREKYRKQSLNVLTSRLVEYVLIVQLASSCQSGSGSDEKSRQRNAVDRSAESNSNHKSPSVEEDGGSGSENGDAPHGQSSGPEAGPSASAGRTLKLITEEHALEELGTGEAQITKVCGRNKDRTNSLIRTFCGENKRPKSLLELQQSLGVDPGNAIGFAATAHSTSLVGRLVSAINPRVISFGTSRAPTGRGNLFTSTGFVRGEQLVEIIASNQDSTVDFFIVAFTQACNTRPNGCHYGDLLTPAVESNWTSVTIYQDEDLKNTIFDCRQCHQPEGQNSAKQLLMQELQNPWTHWMSSARNNPAARGLLTDYQAAHGTAEIYAGISNMANSSPQGLENFIKSNTPNGNNLSETFDSSGISSELGKTPGMSATWNALFERSVRGEIIPVPYYDVKVTDSSLLAKYSKQYADVREGRLDPSALEDIRNVLRQEPKELAAMGFAVPPDLAPEKVLTLACAQCHNSKLDQSISRAKFNVNLTAMKNPKEEIDVAIRRLSMGYSYTKRKAQGIIVVKDSEKEVTEDVLDHVETMPPPRFKRLTDLQIDALIAYLKAQSAKMPN